MWIRYCPYITYGSGDAPNVCNFQEVLERLWEGAHTYAKRLLQSKAQVGNPERESISASVK
eukprot:2719828-Amphidinium_carterae.4